MEAAVFPNNESARLHTLRCLNILDTPPEERFDRLTRMAKRMFRAPIALFSIVDENRQWFKSSDGLVAKETPRNISFCGHAILGDDTYRTFAIAQMAEKVDGRLVAGGWMFAIAQMAEKKCGIFFRIAQRFAIAQMAEKHTAGLQSPVQTFAIAQMAEKRTLLNGRFFKPFAIAQMAEKMRQLSTYSQFSFAIAQMAEK